MGRLLLAAVAVTAGVVVLGVGIDIQSRTPVVRPAPSDEPAPIYASGKIEGATPEVALRPQIAGKITAIPVHEGQVVGAGDVLIQLDDQQYRQQVALASAEVVLAEAQRDRLVNGAHPQQRAEASAQCRAKESELKQAEITWARTEGLLRDQSISPQEADNQRSRVMMLRDEVAAVRARSAYLENMARPDEIRMEEARVAAAKSRLELAKVQVDRTCLRAPYTAEVLKINVRVGELAGPESVEPAIVVADTSRYYVRAYVEELDAPRVCVGMAAIVTVEGLPGQSLRGRVVRLSPRMEEKRMWTDRPTERYDTTTRDVWIELQPGDALVVGLRADVMIQPQGDLPHVAAEAAR
jgi:multidrug resistance efflux pump